MNQDRTLISRQNTITWTRRSMLGALIGLVWSGPRFSTSVAQTSLANVHDPSDDVVSFEWQLPRRYADRTAQYLGVGNDRIFSAPQAEPGRGGPVVLIIVAAVLLVTLARSIVAVYRDIRYGGLIIQDTDRGLYIRHDRRIPGHLVIIRNRNGVTIRELRGAEVNVRDLVPILANTRAAPTR